MAAKGDWKAHQMGLNEFQPLEIKIARLKKKGKLSEEWFKLSVECNETTIKEKPIKSLGKFIDPFVKDATAVQENKDKRKTWLMKVDKSGMDQHAILPKILWPLSIYKYTTFHIEQLEKRINSRLRRWLDLTKSLTSAAL